MKGRRYKDEPGRLHFIEKSGGKKYKEKTYKSKVMLTTKIRALFSIIILAIVAIFAIYSLRGIVAYLVDEKSTENNFTTGHVEIDILEPNWDASLATNIKANQTISKDPQIINNGRNPIYAYMEVSIPNPKIVTVNENGFLANEGQAVATELFTYEQLAGWTLLKEETKSGEVVRTYSYNSTLVPGATTTPLFEEVTFVNAVGGQIDNSNQQIKINAYGIQSEALPAGTSKAMAYNIIRNEGIIKIANAPSIKTGMTPIKFEEGSAIETTADDNQWYSYNDVTVTGSKTSKWANAKTEDGSMWVWIPRFAYKITYTNASNKSQGGKIDVKFLIGTTDTYYDENGEIQTALRCETSNSAIDATQNYVVHPAFTNESSIGYRNGGWDKELEGIWVAKFEAGYANATSSGTDTLDGVTVLSSDNKNTAEVKASSVNYSQSTVWAYRTETGTGADGDISARNWQDGVYGSTTTSIKYPTFQGSTYSMNYINPNDAFLLGKAMNESGNIYGINKSETDSHMMKNSEWGAVAYLAHSQYGLNGEEPVINSYSKNSGGTSTTKAGGNKLASVYAVTGYNNSGKEWNNGGENASTTGNIYGIYDFSGGGFERTAGYVANGNENLSVYGSSVLNAGVSGKTSSKYSTVYPNDSTNTYQSNYEQNTLIYGDAIKETSTAGTGSTSWNGDYSNFAGVSSPFFLRGGRWSDGSSAGLFAFTNSNGSSAYSNGFRAVLV